MDDARFKTNLALISRMLEGEPRFTRRADQDYDTLFEFEWVACCIPLPVLIWLNPHSEGVFLRIVLPPSGPITDAQIAALNRINYHLPIGAFAADQATGEVRFKSTVFIGDSVLSEVLFHNLVASAMDMVRTHHHDVLRIVTGKESLH